MTTLTKKAPEKGTYIIHADFYDADDLPATPKTCLWSLTDTVGNFINDREQVDVSISGTSYDFVLSGDDLVYAEGETRGNRIFTLEVTYDSTYGSDLPDSKACKFEIEDMAAIS